MTARSSEMERGVVDAVWAFSSSFRKPVPSRRRPFTALQSALQPSSKESSSRTDQSYGLFLHCRQLRVSRLHSSSREKGSPSTCVAADPGAWKYCEQALLVQVVIWVTAIVGLVLVSDSGFVELQLILNGLTGKNVKIFSLSNFVQTHCQCQDCQNGK